MTPNVNSCTAALPGAAATQPTASTAPLGGPTAPVDLGQLVPVLEQLVTALNHLVSVLQQAQPAAATGGGQGGATAPTESAIQGAMGAPAATTAPSAAAQALVGAAPTTAPAPTAPAPTSGTVDPSTVRDLTSTNGLSQASLRGLDEAHRFGLPLVSGHRPGGSSRSDHAHGDAIDVGTLPIGAASSTEGTPEMKAFAEHMRLAGQRGELGVKYVILDGKIASSRENWAWRPYTYPGKSAAELEALKQSNRGEYNRIQHFDHVHVSFN